MAKVITTLANAISSINTLLELDSTPPTSGDEDYTVWTNLINISVNIWENEEGTLWKELFTDLTSASDGGKTTVAGQYAYALPTNFRFLNSGYVWVDDTPFTVIKIEDLQLYEQNLGNWVYFTETYMNFNPNLTIEGGSTIKYNYYKDATALTISTSTFEMSDPMFAVYYTLAELTKEEGNQEALNIATQKLEAMKTKNEMTAMHQDNTTINPVGDGFGY
jgi:hypothetical protein